MFIEPKSGSFYDHFLHWFEYTHPFYACLYFVLIIGFNYFYVLPPIAIFIFVIEVKIIGKIAIIPRNTAPTNVIFDRTFLR